MNQLTMTCKTDEVSQESNKPHFFKEGTSNLRSQVLNFIIINNRYVVHLLSKPPNVRIVKESS